MQNKYYFKPFLVSLEDVSGVNFFANVIEGGVVAVGDDGLGLALEICKVVDHLAAEEGAVVGECWLIDDYICSFCFDALHNALDGTLAEVVAVALHRETIHSDCYRRLLGSVLVLGGVVVPAGAAEDGIGDVVFPGAVALNDCRHHVLGYILVVGKELLGVLGEAVTSVAKRGVVIVSADARVEPNSLDNFRRCVIGRFLFSPIFFSGKCSEAVRRKWAPNNATRHHVTPHYSAHGARSAMCEETL